MVKMPEYPLLDVLNVKRKRIDDAKRLVQKREEELAEEAEKLKKCEEARDVVKQHLNDKYDQLRREFEQSTNTDKIQRIRAYIDVVKVKLEEENKKVEEQKKQVEQAEKNLEEAKELLKMRMREVDKLEKHKEEWLKVARREMELEEAKELDEIGSVMFLGHMRKQKNH